MQNAKVKIFAPQKLKAFYFNFKFYPPTGGSASLYNILDSDFRQNDVSNKLIF